MTSSSSSSSSSSGGSGGGGGHADYCSYRSSPCSPSRRSHDRDRFDFNDSDPSLTTEEAGSRAISTRTYVRMICPKRNNACEGSDSLKEAGSMTT
jgi:hypothetical protein